MIGTQQRLMPYNAYKLHETEIDKLLTKHHIDQDYLRYELVNVNVVQADLKKDKRHILPHRRMYFDVDSHNMLVEETFDKENQISCVKQMFLLDQAFHIRSPTRTDAQAFSTEHYDWVGVVHQVLQHS